MKERDENIDNQFRKLKREHPFRVPDNYFESFPTRINSRIQEENSADKIRSLIKSLKPILKMAAIFVLGLLLIYVPYKKFTTAHQDNLVQMLSESGVDDTSAVIPAALFSNFSDEQFLSAFSDMDILESKTLSSEKLADYITANYSDYEILTNN